MQPRGPKTWLVVLLTTLALVGAACGGDDEDAGQGTDTNGKPAKVVKGGTITYASEQGVRNGFNMNTSKDGQDLATQHLVIGVFPQTFRTLPDFSVVPDANLIESAEQVKDSPQTVVIKIKKEAVWSDGTPISAEDYDYNWRQQNGTDKTIDVLSTTGYSNIESLVGSDGGKTVTIVFKTAFSEWKSLFGNLLPAHIVKTTPGGWNTGLDNPPAWSGGPWKIGGYTKDQSLTLVPNEKYWGPKPSLDSIVVRLGIAGTGIPEALANNEIQVAYPQPQIDLVERVKAVPGIKSELNYGLSYEHLDFNFKNEVLAVKEVRQAITWALDRDAIVERTIKQFDAQGKRLDNRIWMTGQPEYEAHGKEYEKRDLGKAATALEKAGYTKGADGIYAKAGKKLSLRIGTTGGNLLRENTQQLIQAQLKELGIDVTIANKEGNRVFGDFETGNFDLALYAWTGGPFAISQTKAIFSHDGEQNTGKYENPTIRDLYDKALATSDKAEAVRISQQIDTILWDDLVTIPLYVKPTFLPYRDTFGNIVDNSTSEGPLWNAYLWGKKA